MRTVPPLDPDRYQGNSLALFFSTSGCVYIWRWIEGLPRAEQLLTVPPRGNNILHHGAVICVGFIQVMKINVALQFAILIAVFALVLVIFSLVLPWVRCLVHNILTDVGYGLVHENQHSYEVQTFLAFAS
jgi:hypothetical protein